MSEKKRRPLGRKTAELKLGGVYSLPDGTTLVVGAGREGRYFLYHESTWAGRTWVINLPIAYEVDGGGRVLSRAGKPTGWRAEDLTGVRRNFS